MCYLIAQWGASIPLSFNLLKLSLEHLEKTAAYRSSKTECCLGPTGRNEQKAEEN
jgi:hypothetical protein